VLERYEGYWAGWDGPHFDRVIIQAVEEPATLRQLIERGEVDIIGRFGINPEALPELERHPDLSASARESFQTGSHNFIMAIRATV
jgi:peptide/nickel transport system substrate-binding protein